MLRTRWNDVRGLPRVCAYCGTSEDLTKEHVLPKCLEASGAQNSKPIIVWACAACNHAKSKLDSDARDLLAIDLYSFEHPSAQANLSGEIKRSLDAGHSKLLLEFIDRAQPEELRDATGRLVGEGMAANLAEDPLTPWLGFLVRGITFGALGEHFVYSFKMDAAKYLPHQFPLVNRTLAEMRAPSFLSVGSHTRFTYRRTNGWKHGFGIWAFQFYEGPIYMAMVVPPDYELTRTLAAS